MARYPLGIHRPAFRFAHLSAGVFVVTPVPPNHSVLTNAIHRQASSLEIADPFAVQTFHKRPCIPARNNQIKQNMFKPYQSGGRQKHQQQRL
jgi:hypothetical protein